MNPFAPLPNPHPAFVHFPIALLLVAIVFDLASLLARRPWLDRAAASLYVLGAIGAGIAFATGRQAADSLPSLPADARLVIADHSDWALRTLLVFAAFGILRFGIAWRDRRESRARAIPLRWGVALAALLAQWLPLRTAELGGTLVYRHGVGVRGEGGTAERAPRPAGGQNSPAESVPGAPSDTARSGEPARRDSTLVRAPDGTITWNPKPEDAALLGRSILVMTDGKADSVQVRDRAPVAPKPTAGPAEGLSLTVSDRSWILFPESFGDVLVEAKLDLRGFTGEAGVAHHVRSGSDAGRFQVSTGGEAAIIAGTSSGERILDRAKVDLPDRPVVLSISAAGSHLMASLDGKTVAHGHISPSSPGRAGLVLSGKGPVRILSLKVTPLRRS